MVGVSGSAARRDDVDLIEFVRRLVRYKWLIGVLTVLGLVSAVIYLHLAEPLYRTELRVAPAASSTGTSRGLGGLGGLAALADVSLGSSSQSVPPFDFYLETLRSRALAAALAEDVVITRSAFKAEWDMEKEEWLEPRSWLRSMRRVVGSVLGVRNREWAPPGAAELQEFIRRNVSIEKPGTKDPQITTLVLEHSDTRFAEYLLANMSRVADDRVRQDGLETARSYAGYLSEKLRTEQIAEYRRDLSEALAEQEKSIMMASSSMPYAATIVESPTSSSMPIKPNAILVLLFGVAAGAMLGFMLAVTDYRAFLRSLR